MSTKDESKVAGGKARAESLDADQRKSISIQAANKRWGNVPEATHQGTVKVGDLDIECAVLEDGRRLLSERAVTKAFGGKRGGSHWKRLKQGGANYPVYLSAKNIIPFINSDLASALTTPVRYKTSSGAIANGLDAELLPKVCEVWLEARDAGKVLPSQAHLAAQADILIRAFATVGIIALVDEATGFQRDRAATALAEILEKYIAKELQPWAKTFPDDYYEQLFRLRGLDFPSHKVKRPQYFGHLTNDIIYDRLAPKVREELGKISPKDSKGRRKNKFFQGLTPELGHPKLREHMSSVLAIMKLSDNYEDFQTKLDKIHAKFDESLPLDFGLEDGGEI